MLNIKIGEITCLKLKKTVNTKENIFSCINLSKLDECKNDIIETIDYETIYYNDDDSKNIDNTIINNDNTKNIVEILDSIKISDGIYDSIFYIDNNKNLVNKNGLILGEIFYWIDIKNRIPKKYKNSENVVIVDNVPQMKYLLYESIYHQLQPKIYKKYKYDNILDIFVDTRNIINI